MGRFCTNCGTEVSPESRFCPACGASKAGGPVAVGVPAHSNDKKSTKQDRLYCIIAGVLVLTSFFIPVGAVLRGGNVSSRFTIFASAFTASDAATFSAFLAFMVPVLIFALFAVKLMFGFLLKDKLAVLDTLRYTIGMGLSVFGIIFTILFMSRMNDIFFRHGSPPVTTSASPMFFLTIAAYLFIAGSCLKQILASRKTA